MRSASFAQGSGPETLYWQRLAQAARVPESRGLPGATPAVLLPSIAAAEVSAGDAARRRRTRLGCAAPSPAGGGARGVGSLTIETKRARNRAIPSRRALDNREEAQVRRAQR